MTNLFSRTFCSFLLIIGLCSAAGAEPLDSIYVEEINMIKGELEQLKVYNLTRLSISDPGIADVADADTDELLIVAKEIGNTTLFLWDQHGKRAITIHVYSEDLPMVKDRLSHLLKAARIHELALDINDEEGKVVITGEVPSHKKAHYEQIAAPFASQIISLVKEDTSEDLIQIDMQVTELNETLTQNLGVEWLDGTQTFDAETGGYTTEFDDDGGMNPTFVELLPGQSGTQDIFNIGGFRRSLNSALVSRVNLLVQEGKGRILSKPKLVVKSGEEANFLVGGEIPIRTTTSSASGSTQENVEYKDYGISMDLTPVIHKGKIDVTLHVEVSDIDSANAVGNDVAFTNRSASTHLYLEDRQTIVMAGLIKQNRSEQVNKVPLLGNLPVLGPLFRNRKTVTPNQDTELIISLTPTILTKEADEAAVARRASARSEIDATSAAGATTSRAQAVQIPEQISEYVRSIQQKITQAIIYPPEAEQFGWEGTVKLGLLILNDGTLAFASVKESSGYDVFDDSALNIARNIAPYMSFPVDLDLQELNVTIPIVYSLKRN